MDEKKLLKFEFVENGFIVIFDENKYVIEGKSDIEDVSLKSISELIGSDILIPIFDNFNKCSECKKYSIEINIKSEK